MYTKDKTKVIAIRIPEEVYNRLKEISKLQNISLSDLVRQLIIKNN